MATTTTEAPSTTFDNYLSRLRMLTERAHMIADEIHNRNNRLLGSYPEPASDEPTCVEPSGLAHEVDFGLTALEAALDRIEHEVSRTRYLA